MRFVCYACRTQEQVALPRWGSGTFPVHVCSRCGKPSVLRPRLFKSLCLGLAIGLSLTLIGSLALRTFPTAPLLVVLATMGVCVLGLSVVARKWLLGWSARWSPP